MFSVKLYSQNGYCFICFYSAFDITSAWLGDNFELSHYYFWDTVADPVNFWIRLCLKYYAKNRNLWEYKSHHTHYTLKCDITVSCSKIKQEHRGNNFTLKSPHLLWRRWYRFISGDAKKREAISAVWDEIQFKVGVRHIFLMLSYVLVVPKNSLVIMSPKILAKLLFCSQTLCAESIQHYHWVTSIGTRPLEGRTLLWISKQFFSIF